MQLITRFYEFMKRSGTSESYQKNNLKTIIYYGRFLGNSISFNEVKNKTQIISFLDTKFKTTEEDPDKRWITTCNDYLGRIKYFFRWMHNHLNKEFEEVQFSDWETPGFVTIKTQNQR